MQAILIESEERAPGLRHFVFETAGGEPLRFEPGQFVSFRHEIGGKEITRAYSIASAPNNSPRFDLNLVEGGHFSPHLFGLRPGEAVEMREPLGMFTLRHPQREALFIATGTGIAPFRSMLQAHLTAGSAPFTLIYGVRHESHLIYRREFEAMAAQWPQFRFWPTLSRPAEGWSGRRGRVQAHVEEALAGRRDADVYLCGLKLMVDELRNILRGMGFDRKQIIYEKYD
jgi:CDP-4-dehydro-6-deoxyglucose reductase